MLSKLENQIQILNSKSSVWSVMEEMTQSENQEEAFYVCDIGNIITKYLNWKKLMPRVETYYESDVKYLNEVAMCKKNCNKNYLPTYVSLVLAENHEALKEFKWILTEKYHVMISMENYINLNIWVYLIQIKKAVKCNDHPFVLETLATLGTGFDCASKEEISKILDLNVQPTRIIFANPAKPESHIKYAETVNILRMTFDNQLELEKIKRSHPNAELILRIKYDDEMAHYKFGGKFGCDHLTEAPELLTKAQQLGIKVIGVSFHIGSGSQNPKVYGEAIKAARHVFDLASNIGFKFNILDIGGGFPGAHGTSIEEISKNVNENINLHFSDPSIKIVAEPGRYYVDSAFTVATRIHSIATTKPDSTGIFTYMYYVNTGAYSTFMNVFFNEQYKPQALNKNKRDKKYPTIIWGPTCDSLDKICEKNKMPKMNIGDWIAFENMGAYTLTISSNFNGFPIPKVHGVVCEKLWKKYKHLMMGSEIKFDNCKEHLRCQLSEKLLYSNKFSSVN